VKQVLVSDGLREAALRPRALVEEYVALLDRDRRAAFGDRSGFVEISCPGCKTERCPTVFTKAEFAYARCPRCGSVFASPRPMAEALREFRRTSAAIRYWISRVETETVRDRAWSIAYPRAVWIQAGADEIHVQPKVLVDLDSKSALFIESITRAGTFERVVVAEPQVDPEPLARLPGLVVEPSLATLLARPAQVAAVSAQECLERDADPDRLIGDAMRLLAPGGLLFLTTLTWSGFDFQVLGGRASAILPPIHLNLLSLDGIRSLLTRHGFELLELSATGQLDTEIVVHAVAEDPTIELPPFVDELIRRRDERVHRAFQQFLQEALLSSHVRVVARRPAAMGEGDDE
jgi:ribosomal protein S27E/SAM-dependent methyltransferase